MVELVILGVCASICIAPVVVLIGIFITSIDEVVTKRRKKRAKAAEKQKKANEKKETTKILIRWRQ